MHRWARPFGTIFAMLLITGYPASPSVSPSRVSFASASTLPALATADPPPTETVTLIGRLGDETARTVLVEGHLAYVGSRGQLTVFDVSNPAYPATLGRIDLPGEVSLLGLSGNRLYLDTRRTVEDFNPTIRIIDVAKPASPREIATYTPKYSITGFVAVGDFAYFIDGPDGPRGVDFSDPVNPRPLTSATPLPLGTRAFDKETRRLYIASSAMGNGPLYTSGFYTFDVSNPANPKQIGYFKLAGGTFDYALAVRGNYAYIGDVSRTQVFDISDPNNIAPIGGYQPGGQVLRLELSGNYLFGLAGQLTIASLVDPQNPVVIASCRLPDQFWPSALAVSGKAAFVPSYATGGILIFRFDEPAWLSQIGPSSPKDALVWGAIAQRATEIAVVRPRYLPAVFKDPPRAPVIQTDGFNLTYEAGNSRLTIGAGSFNLGLGGQWEEISFRGPRAGLGHYSGSSGKDQWVIDWWEPGGTGWYGLPSNRVEGVTHYFIALEGLGRDELLRIAYSLERITEGASPMKLPATGASPFPTSMAVLVGSTLLMLGLLLRRRHRHL